jgi:hypothetical protein
MVLIMIMHMSYRMTYSYRVMDDGLIIMMIMMRSIS